MGTTDTIMILIRIYIYINVGPTKRSAIFNLSKISFHTVGVKSKRSRNVLTNATF